MLGGYRFLELFGQPDSVSKSELLKESIKAIRNYLHIQRPPTQNMVTIHQVSSFYLKLNKFLKSGFV